MIGPNCVLATANYPILPELREKAYQYNLPLRIGRNCWLGTGVIVVPSVTIGDNTVIGSFMCQGKMPMSVRQRYENMKKSRFICPIWTQWSRISTRLFLTRMQMIWSGWNRLWNKYSAGRHLIRVIWSKLQRNNDKTNNNVPFMKKRTQLYRCSTSKMVNSLIIRLPNDRLRAIIPVTNTGGWSQCSLSTRRNLAHLLHHFAKKKESLKKSCQNNSVSLIRP